MLVVPGVSRFALVLRHGDSSLRITEMKDFVPQKFTVLGWQVSDIETKVKALAAEGIVGKRYDGMDQDDLGMWNPPGSDVRIF